MAKKSAKSKGYRKQTGKKPYLSKRDIVLLCVLVAAIAVAAFFLFHYDDGALKVQNGAVVADGDNWLIVNGSNTRGGARYYKLGEMGDLEGYAREAKSLVTDANIPEYSFTPEAEDTGVSGITVTSSHSTADVLSKYAVSMLSETENIDIGEIQTGELGGRTVTYFTYTAEPTEAEEGEEAKFSRVMSGYIDATHDSCVAIHVESRADAAESCLGEEALTELLARTVSAVSLESAK